MLEYVKNKPKDILSYTVIWYKNTCPNDIIKSYFYGYDLLDVCAKFYYDKYVLDYMITSVSLNSESQKSQKKPLDVHNTPNKYKKCD